jgi:TonB-linked SusC/RagA family outer membrane protein
MESARQSRTWHSLALGLLAMLVFAVPGQAQTGQIAGKVIETGTGKPLVGAQVFIPNTGLGVLTAQNGSYLLLNVPVGPTTVRVTMIGYAASDDKVTVTAGSTVAADFTMHQSAVQMNEIVVTGVGVATERRKLGNTVASVDIAKMTQHSAATNVTQLLQGQVPGVTMETSGGLAGEGMRITIRGGSSITQYNQPIVYVDGVRVANGGGWAPGVDAQVGGTADPSRLADINPDDIARIEVLKGAAAATLYGTEASAGVIQIFTKHGSAGPTRYTAEIQQGISNYPGSAYGPEAGFARTAQQAAYLSKFWGQNITPYVPFSVNDIPWAYETGHSQMYSVGATGGSNVFTYHVSGRYQYENGPYGGSQHFSVPGFKLAQDIDNHKQANVSLTFFPTDKLRFRVTSNYTESYHESPQMGNNIFAGFPQLLDSKPELAGCANASTYDMSQIIAPMTCAGGPSNLTGVAAFATAREGWLLDNWQNTHTFQGSVNGNWQIQPKLIGDVTFGVESVSTRGVASYPFGWNVDNFASYDVTGDRTVGTEFDHYLTMDAHLNWDADITGDLSSTAVAGVQIFETQTNSGWEEGTDFPGPGINVVSAGANLANFESYLKEVQLGYFGQEQLGWKNFAFLTLGARFDKHSAFGATAPSVVYPKASISVVPSSLPGWSHTRVSTVRFRAAIGQSGLQPGAFDKFTTFAPLAASTGSGLVPNNLGNQNLKPEVTTEVEGGGNFGFFNDRIALDATYWNKVTNDLLYPRQYAPSGGFSNQQLSNIGQMKSHGVELSLNGQVFTRKNVALSLYVNGAFLRQEVTSLGGAPPIKVSGSYPRPRNFIKVGYAPGSFFGAVLADVPAGTYPISVDAGCTPATKAQLLALLANPINPGDLHVLVKGGDYITTNGSNGCSTGDFLSNYEGKPFPDWTGGFGGTLTFLNNWQLTGSFEYKLGNYTLEDLAGSFHQANPLIGRNTPLAAKTEATLENPASTPDQRLAAAVTWATRLDALAPVSGLNEMKNGDFIRLREVDLTYNLPESVAAKIGATSGSVTLSGHNIWMWTKYTGPDPEMNWQGLRSPGMSAVDNIDNNFLVGNNGWGLPLPHVFTLAIRATF